jgi:hypothetical protein
MHVIVQFRGDQAGEHSRADAGSEHPAPTPAEPLQSRPHRANDEFRREVRVLRATGKRGVVGARHRLLELGAQLIPTGAKPSFSRSAEHGIGKLGGAEASEADQPRLFLARRGPIGALDFGREADGIEIVAGTLLPAPGKTAIGVEDEIVTTLPGSGRALRRMDGLGGRCDSGTAGVETCPASDSPAPKSLPKAVTPRPRPDESVMVLKRSSVKGSSLDTGEFLVLGRTRSPGRMGRPGNRRRRFGKVSG